MKNRTFVVSMDVTSLFTNIPLNEGIEIVCIAYENFCKVTHLFLYITCEKRLHYSSKKIISSLLESSPPTNPRYRDVYKDRSFPFTNIFMAYIETQSLSKIVFKLTVWKRYIDDISFTVGHK